MLRRSDTHLCKKAIDNIDYEEATLIKKEVRSTRSTLCRMVREQYDYNNKKGSTNSLRTNTECESEYIRSNVSLAR